MFVWQAMIIINGQVFPDTAITRRAANDLIGGSFAIQIALNDK